jgi:hypothetical protein
VLPLHVFSRLRLPRAAAPLTAARPGDPRTPGNEPRIRTVAELCCTHRVTAQHSSLATRQPQLRPGTSKLWGAQLSTARNSAEPQPPKKQIFDATGRSLCSSKGNPASDRRRRRPGGGMAPKKGPAEKVEARQTLTAVVLADSFTQASARPRQRASGRPAFMAASPRVCAIAELPPDHGGAPQGPAAARRCRADRVHAGVAGPQQDGGGAASAAATSPPAPPPVHNVQRLCCWLLVPCSTAWLGCSRQLPGSAGLLFLWVHRRWWFSAARMPT